MTKSAVTLLLLMLPGLSGANAISLAADDTSGCPFAKNCFFAEAGGNGISLSINYERLLSNDFGIRAGYGGLFGIGSSVPLMVNLYVGGKRRLELGAGLVFLPVWNDDASFGKAKSFVLTSTVGLRLQPCEGGVLLRLSLTPLYDPNGRQFKILGGVSVGSAY